MYNKLKKYIEKTVYKKSNSDEILFKNVGISKSELFRLRNSKLENDTSILYNKEIKITNAFWHLHSLKEIFFDEVYKFDSSTTKPVILDCGANIGLSAIYFKKKFPNSEIIAFEPDKNIFKMLLFNINSFGFNNIKIENKAVWINEGVMNFLSNGDLGGQLNLENKNKNKVAEFDVKTVRLKNYLERQIEFLKIDIEGAEIDIIEDCADLLYNVKYLFIEYHSSPNKTQKLDILLNILTAGGFKYYIKEAWNNLPYPFLRNNYNPYFDLQLNIFAFKP